MASSKRRVISFIPWWKRGTCRHAGKSIVCCLTVFLVLGCREETIEHYTAPKADEPPPMHASTNKPAGRILGLILPHNDVTWFCKLSGPTTDVEEHKAEFDQFIHSIAFNDGGEPPITWDVPEGWRKTPSPKGRFATFRLGPKDAGLELTVYFFATGPQTSDVLANVNRWREQLQLPPIAREELGPFITDPKLKAGPSTIADLASRSPLAEKRGGGDAKPNLK